MKHSENISTIAAALAASQVEMKPALINSTNPHLRNRYADLASVMEAAKPLAKNGIAIIQSPSVITTDGVMAVSLETLLIHTSGEWISETMQVPLPPDSRGVTVIQQVGSTITYLRRYLLTALVGIVADEDTDGNSPTPPRPTPPRPTPPSNTSPVGEAVQLFEYRYGDGTIVQSSAAEKAAFDEYRRQNGEALPESLPALRAWYAMQKQVET